MNQKRPGLAQLNKVYLFFPGGPGISGSSHRTFKV